MPYCENASHQRCLQNQESIRQSAIARAAGDPVAIRAADIAYHRAIAKSAVENGVPATQAQTALRELGFAETPETFTRTDSTEIVWAAESIRLRSRRHFQRAGL
jgi:hypothetical protein